MEIFKVFWFKNNMFLELWDKCKFYDLVDVLIYLVIGNEIRSFCSIVCKQGFVLVGVDGSVKGWQEDFYEEIGFGDLIKDDFKCMGGVNGVVSFFFLFFKYFVYFFLYFCYLMYLLYCMCYCVWG